jgi:hypothetical protein
MEKSINDIWTKGFENSNELSSPKIMNLYNQKSKLLVDKIKKTSETDNKSLLPIAFIFAVGFSIAGHILLGFYGMILIIALFFFNRKLLSSLENIKITSSNYDYLIAYKKAIDKIIESSFKLLGFGLPIIVITGFWLYFRSSSKYAHFINSYSSLHIILIIIALAGIISLAGLSIYKITSHTLYRKHLNDLNMIISDLKNME